MLRNNYKNCTSYIQEFNKNNQISMNIDTIRIKFNKQHKLEELKALGNWHKLDKSNSQIKNKLIARLDLEELTSVYQLENHNIYFYNSREDRPKYRKATLIIFGMKQYHKSPPPKSIIERLFNLLTFGTSKNDINLDICYDMETKPNIENLSKYFKLSQYWNGKGKISDTFYINDTSILMLDKICIYNKAIKNSLDFVLYRIEATISIPNIRVLALPLYDFKNIIQLARG